MKYFAVSDGETVLAERTREGVRVGDSHITFDVVPLGPDEAHFVFQEESARIVGVRTSDGWRIRLRGQDYRVELEGERARAIRELAGHDAAPVNRELLAPMPGLVVKVLVEPGQTVIAGDGLVVVEAMKMENELRAEADRVVGSVEVVAGDTVERNQVLIRFEDGTP